MQALEFYCMEKITHKIFKCLAMQLFCAMNINAQVINEVLFNPVKDGFDYVEIYNRGNSPVNASDLLIANRNAANEIASIKTISKDSVIIMPGDYAVITLNKNWLKQHYIVPDSAILIQLAALPSLPDDEGCIVLMRKSDSSVIDEVCYSENWHFKMLTNLQGVALERINPELPSQDKNNWTSASSSSGFGTPGYENSQHLRDAGNPEQISVLPEVFSPNNDGQNDFASINIKNDEPGKVVNAVVFNAMGRPVRYLLKNQILGMNNRFIWDGYDDKDELLPSGIYIIFTQIFDAKGSVFKYRNCVVLNSFPP
jgi:hypothetical protein